MDMEYWKRFENSGRIEDYLNFVSCERREGGAAGTDSTGNAAWDGGLLRKDRMEGRSGEDLHAGKRNIDRNHIEAVSRGRI